MIPFHCLVSINLVSYKDYYKYCFPLSHLQILACISFHKLTSQITLMSISKSKTFKTVMYGHTFAGSHLYSANFLAVHFVQEEKCSHIWKSPYSSNLFQMKCAVYKTIVKRFYMTALGGKCAYMHGNEYVLDVP